MEKGSKHDFAYQAGPGTPPRCDKCQYFVIRGACLLVKGAIDGKNGSCNYWVDGPAKEYSDGIVPPFSKEYSGYVTDPDGPRCGKCIFYLTPRRCRLVAGDIDPKIGCCSAWKK